MPRLATSICCLICLTQCSTLAAQPPRFSDRAVPPQHGDGPFRSSATELAIEAGQVQQASYAVDAPDETSAEPTQLASGGDQAAASPKPVPLSRPDEEPPLLLARPGAGNKLGSGAGMMPPLVTIGGSLAVVLSLFFVAAWLLKRGMPRGALALPSEVVEVLGSTALPSRQQAYLVRCGSKLLLVAVGTGGSETLTEITDPMEVDRLAGICRQAHPQSATAAFRNILQQFGGEREDGFPDNQTAERRLPAASIVGNRPSARRDADV